jgi:hypothetical protein
MATQQRVRRIRGTVAQNAAVALDDGCFVVKEPVDGTVWVHDGSTLGGFQIGGAAAQGAMTMHRVTSGTSDVLGALPTAEVMILWTSAAGGAKTQTVPAANSLVDGAKLYVKMGNSVSGTLTTTPVAGTMNDAANIASNAGDNLMFIADLTRNDWVLA